MPETTERVSAPQSSRRARTRGWAVAGLIAATGSISGAAREMGMSYRRAWQLVEALNTSFTEPVVITATGGRRGGGAEVTAFGRQLATQFHAMEGKASAAIARDLGEFTRHLRRGSGRRSRSGKADIT